MANKGSGKNYNAQDMVDAVQGFGGVSSPSSPATPDATQQVPEFQKLIDSISNGNEAATRRLWDGASKSVNRYFQDESRNMKESLTKLSQKDRAVRDWNRTQEISLRTQYKELEILKATTSLTGKAKQDAIVQKTNDIEFTKNKLNLGQKQLQQINTLRTQEGMAAQQRERFQEKFQRAQEDGAEKLQQEQNARQRSFAYQLGAHDFNPAKTLKSYGHQKLKESLSPKWGGTAGTAEGAAEGAAGAEAGGGALGSVGGILGGIGGMVGGMVLGKIAEKFMENMKRSWAIRTATADVWKGMGPAGQSLSDFRGEMRRSTEGFWVKPEEEVGLLNTMRPAMGRQKESGAMGNVVQTSAMLARAYGTDLNSQGQFGAQLIRSTRMTGSAADQAKFATTFADALGRSRMVGLQEEMMQGVNELVEVTKAANVAGASPNMFMDMIANLSSNMGADNKNMRGLGAAQTISSMSQNLANPQNNFATIISHRALQRVIEKANTEGNVDKDKDGKPLQKGLPYLLEKRSQGAGLTVGNKAYGMDWITESIKEVLKTTGGDKGLAQMTLSQSFSIPQEQARRMVEHIDDMTQNGGGVMDMFKLPAGTQTGMAGAQLLSEMGQARTDLQQSNPNITKDPEKYKKEILRVGLENYRGEDKESLQKMARDMENQGKTSEDILQALLNQAKDTPGLSKEDAAREAMVRADKTLLKLTDVVVDIGAKFGALFSSGGDWKEAQRQIEQQRQAKEQNTQLSEGKHFSIPANVTPGVDAITRAIEGSEGNFAEGSLQWRNNNPSNLKPINGQPVGEGGFRKFGTPYEGHLGAIGDLLSKMRKNPEWSIQNLSNRWLGNKFDDNTATKEGDPVAKAKTIAKLINKEFGTSFTPDDKLGDIEEKISNKWFEKHPEQKAGYVPVAKYRKPDEAPAESYEARAHRADVPKPVQYTEGDKPKATQAEMAQQQGQQNNGQNTTLTVVTKNDLNINNNGRTDQIQGSNTAKFDINGGRYDHSIRGSGSASIN